MTSPSRIDPAAAPRRLRALDPRSFTWEATSLVERDCPFCAGSGPARLVRPDGLEVRRCERCSAWFVCPAPDAGQLERFYHGYHGRHRVEAFAGTPYTEKLDQPTTADPAALAARLRAWRPLDDFRMAELASMLDLARARVLDVGCGVGKLLCGLARLGAEVEGVDLDPDAVAFARDSLGLAGVRRGGLERIEGEGRFDLVVLQDVLEHALEPRALLERATELLAPGGLMYLWTPNATFAGEQDQPLVFRADFEHLQFLTTGALLRLALDLGLETVHLESTGYLGSVEDAAQRPGLNAAAPARHPLRARLRRLPGFRRLNALRLAWLGRHPERSGTYHLFAILRRPRV